MSSHIVVCGLDGLAVRIIEELQRLDENVVVVAANPAPGYLAAVRPWGVDVVEGGYRDDATLRRARVDRAKAIALVEQDDVGNLHAALAAQEINPGIRVVIRLFNDALGQSIQALLKNCTVLSASSIAAPLFVAAALNDTDSQVIEVEGWRFRVRHADTTEQVAARTVPLGYAADGGTALLPDEVQAGGMILRTEENDRSSDSGFQEVSARHVSVPTRRVYPSLSALAAVIDRRLRLLLVIIGALVALSVTVFSTSFGLSPVDALYFTLTTITTTGYGDITVLHASLPVKIYGIALLVAGAGLIAVFYALLIESVVGARLIRVLGGVHGGMRGHVVVCGLGNLGSKIVSLLCARDIPVVVVERDDDCPNFPLVRRLKVPVIVADAARPESMQQAQLGDARCVVIATNDDASNLETALNVRQSRPDIRVVLRLFDHDLAVRIERAFAIPISRSVSSLAAPAFAAALIEREIVAVIPVGRRVILIAEVLVEAGSGLAGATIESLEQVGGVRVLCRPRTDRPVSGSGADLVLNGGDVVVVAATRAGLAQLVQQTRKS